MPRGRPGRSHPASTARSEDLSDLGRTHVGSRKLALLALDSEIARIAGLARGSNDPALKSRAIALKSRGVTTRLRDAVRAECQIAGSAVTPDGATKTRAIVTFFVLPLHGVPWLVSRTFAVLVDLRKAVVVRIVDPLIEPSARAGAEEPFTLAVPSGAGRAVTPTTARARGLAAEANFMAQRGLAAGSGREVASAFPTVIFDGNGQPIGTKPDFKDDA